MPDRIVIILLVSAFVCAANDADFFESRVRPVLASKCYSCHGADKQFGNLRLDSRDRILRGGTTGPAAIAVNLMKAY